MFRYGTTPALAAIVDWEMATIGDPVLDLAWLARQWPSVGEDKQTRYVDYEGMPNQEEIVDVYRELTGNPLDCYRYYEVLANFKLAIVLEGGYVRFLRGEVDNPKVAHYDEAILKAERVASALIAQA
jgi:aminoglycoside phosphotransferase (APT) family kinase protein